MPTAQSARVVRALAARDAQPSARAWFEGVLAAIGEDDAIDDDTVQQLEWRCRGDYGLARLDFERDGAAHVWFWRALHHRFPGSAWVQALLADVLYQHGDRGQQAEAYPLYLEAVRRDPQQFVRSAGEFYDVAQGLGGEAWFEFHLARLRFYLDQLARGAMGEDDVREQVRETMREFAADPTALGRVVALVRAAGVTS